MKRKIVAYTTVDITTLIVTIRGKRVILDEDLARIYGVATKRLNEQVRRNTNRFPPDFAFVLTDQEVTNLRSQIATSSCDGIQSQFATSSHGGRRYRPYVFTPLESSAIYTGDDIDKGSIPYRKSGKNPILSNGVN
jgi:hypothetical protein